MNVNEIASELRNESKTNKRKTKEWSIKQLNQFRNWLETEVEPFSNICKDQNKFAINEIPDIKKKIECSLSLIDAEIEVNDENANNSDPASYIVVIIVGSVYPLKSWLFALINAITSGSCALVHFNLSEDYADFTLIENLFKRDDLDKVRSFLIIF